MANYKDIISGALGNFVNKVKGVAESGAVRDFCEQGVDRAKAVGRIAKLNLEITGENEELKRMYTELGKLYYEQAKDAPEGYFAPLFAQIGDIQASVKAKEEEIAALKECSKANCDPNIDVEVVSFEDEDCCCEGKCESFCEKVENACECACDKVEEVVEKVEDFVEEKVDAIEDAIEK